MIAGLSAQVERESGLPLLRAYWYDAAKNAVPDFTQGQIGELPRVKLRLGRFGVDGQQKGVDVRIGLDLVTHARNSVAEVFFVVSGDDDLTEAVEEAQIHGVSVVVLAVPNDEGRAHAVSRHLWRAADQLVVVDPAVIDEAVTRNAASERSAAARTAAPLPAAVTVPSPADIAARVHQVAPPQPVVVPAYSSSTGRKPVVGDEYVEVSQALDEIDKVAARVAESVRRSADAGELQAIVAGRPSIPTEIDRALLLDLSDALDVYDLSDQLRYKLRERFWAAIAG